jgi:hypothetical protein
MGLLFYYHRTKIVRLNKTNEMINELENIKLMNMKRNMKSVKVTVI